MDEQGGALPHATVFVQGAACADGAAGQGARHQGGQPPAEHCCRTPATDHAGRLLGRAQSAASAAAQLRRAGLLHRVVSFDRV